ncbi:MAG: flagellar filament capping protein FliD, partial [Pseudomonadota bacterium]
GKRLAEGHRVEVSPSSTRREEHGFVHGRVIRVAHVPASSAGLLRTLQNDQLVRSFTTDLGTETEFITIGRKGSQSIARLKKDLSADFPIKDPARVNYLRPVAKLLQDKFLSGEYQRVLVAFNKALPAAAGGLTALADIGITFQKDGTLKLDATKLTTVLNDATKDVSTLFAAVAKPTDPLVSFVTATADTRNGSYALNITQLATQGKAVGGAAAVLTINAGVNDALAFTVDGVAGSIALSSAGVKVGVTQAADVITVTSSRYGSASIVALTGGNGMADVFGVPVQTDGADVAGTIGGFAATGAGQTLTGAGNALGLALKITGGATGDRGTVNYARGYAYELDKLVGKILETNNSIENRINGVKSSIDDVGDRRVALEARLQAIETRLRTQYSALDALLTRMQSTSASLAQQLANLPSSSNSRN